MNIVLCEYAERRKFTAGNKARTDTLKILMESGYSHIPLFRSKNNKIIILLQMVIGCLETFAKAGKDDLVFIQYPYYPAVVNRLLLLTLSLFRRIKGYRIVVLIHDMVGLRMEGNKTNNISGEIEILNRADHVICHNMSMLNVIKKSAINRNVKLEVLGPFDYLYDGEPINTSYNNRLEVIIAGNLSREKSGYVYKLHDLNEYIFNLYGVDYNDECHDNVRYLGQYPPDKLIENLQGNFGLVWDGEELVTCDGAYGEYLKYNNPHKFSLYLAAGIPLIVWSESALASYVKAYDIGICVKSLKALNDELAVVTEERYNQLVNNVLNIRKDIVSGEHLKNVLRNLAN